MSQTPQPAESSPAADSSAPHQRPGLDQLVEHDAEPRYIISTANTIEPINTRYHKTVRGPFLTMSKPCRNTCIW